jgi:hypothetical protein
VLTRGVCQAISSKQYNKRFDVAFMPCQRLTREVQSENTRQSAVGNRMCVSLCVPEL